MEHARLGCALLPSIANPGRRTLAAALAESYLLAGRIEFFDLRQPDRASDTLLRALQSAGEADDPLLGSAILAHTAFIPGWAGDRDAAAERMIASRTYARRGPASAIFRAWLDAVEAECETRCGDTRSALRLIAHAEDTMATGSEHATPAWMDWFSPARLAAFKGNTQLKAGHLPQARATLTQAIEDLPPDADKQRSVLLGDLAAVEAAERWSSSLSLGTPQVWNASARFVELSLRGSTSRVSGISTTASTTGGQPSALSSIELCDLLGELS
jgi:hypothetical protein